LGKKLSGRIQGWFLDSSAIIAAGSFIFSQKTQRYLWLLRNKSSHWAFPGGKLIKSETVYQGLQREIKEELGFVPEFEKVIPLEKYSSWNSQFVYYNFWILVPDEFVPQLNAEHAEFLWCSRQRHPRPLLPAISEMLYTSEILDKLKILESLNFQKSA